MKSIKQNCGKSIQGVANVIFAIGVVIAVIEGIIVLAIAIRLDEIGIGFALCAVVVGVGCLISWVSTLLLRGFGELVWYTAENATYLEATRKQSPPKPKAKIKEAKAQVKDVADVEEIWSDESVDTLVDMCDKALEVNDPMEAQRLCAEISDLWEEILEEVDSGNIDLSAEEQDDIESQMSTMYNHFIEIGYDPYSDEITGKR
ncbi:MAG: hypothetical protein LUE20_02005 [Oscillospiraceae bacterium]|nr:hypothetical protein [Oscillospiraceae bacterium]